MPKSMGGHMGPQPLRDADNLLGLPHLHGADLTKVTLANQLYRAAIVILQLCFVFGLPGFGGEPWSLVAVAPAGAFGS